MRKEKDAAHNHERDHQHEYILLGDARLELPQHAASEAGNPAAEVDQAIDRIVAAVEDGLGTVLAGVNVGTVTEANFKTALDEAMNAKMKPW